MNCREIITKLKSMTSEGNREGMGRFGINVEKALGVSVVELRRLAKEIGKNHELAEELWNTGIHEARLLACFVDEPKKVTEEQLERWVVDFDSWDLVDQCCGNLIDKTPFAWDKAREWAGRDEEFVKRAGFALMAALAVHDKKAPDEKYVELLPLIIRESDDGRNFVKKAVNWALRQIGKRNLALNAAVITAAEKILARDTKSARWIARDTLRELRGDEVQQRLRVKAEKAKRSR